jgi:hypothetical protein
MAIAGAAKGGLAALIGMGARSVPRTELRVLPTHGLRSIG